MRFTKMHGLGNDYVYVNCFKEKVENPAEAARYVSDRHFGIGSDGLILICPSEKADFEMVMYNADGSRSEMCGNGIRCVAKYVYDYGLTDKTSISVETLGGIKYLDLTVEDGKAVQIRVDMGMPELRAGRIPILFEVPEEGTPDGAAVLGEEVFGDNEQFVGQEAVEPAADAGEQSADAGDQDKEVIDEPIVVDGMEYKITGVSMGNPHAVVFLEDVEKLDIDRIGPKFENHERFPRRINTEFVRVIDRETIEMRVWERGSGETLACGTGACAAAVASILNGLAGRKVTVKLSGGSLMSEWDEESGKVYMTGPAVTVFEGEIELPAGIHQQGGRVYV